MAAVEQFCGLSVGVSKAAAFPCASANLNHGGSKLLIFTSVSVDT